MVDIHRPELKRSRQRKRWLWLAAASAVLTAIAVFAYSLEPAVPKVDRSAVWVDTVRFGEFMREVRGSGSLVPRVTRWVPVASAGRVERVLVRPGARVEPDTVLVELSNPELVQEVEDIRWEAETQNATLTSLAAELERELLEARSELAEIRAESEGARLEADAEKELAQQRIVSRVRFQQTQLQANQLEERVRLETVRIERLQSSIQAQLQAERARLEQARQRYRRQNQRLEDLNVRAGVAGVLQRIDVEEGQQVGLGVNVGRVARPDELIAELRIPEGQARDIQLKQRVTVDTRNAKVPGSVIRIDPAVVNGTVQVDVELQGNLPPGARPDLSVDGVIHLERLKGVLFVGRPTHGQPESTVSLFKIDEDGHAQRVPVKLGRASVNAIEIRAGLKAGDQVILSNNSDWDDHDRIRLN